MYVKVKYEYEYVAPVYSENVYILVQNVLTTLNFINLEEQPFCLSKVNTEPETWSSLPSLSF